MNAHRYVVLKQRGHIKVLADMRGDVVPIDSKPSACICLHHLKGQ